MKAEGVRRAGFLGYADAYGEIWLKDFTAAAEEAGIAVVAVERFARTDTSVNARALKLRAANPDAVLIVAAGAGSVLPRRALQDRGFKGALSTPMPRPRRIWRASGARPAAGMSKALVVSGPVVVAEQLPAGHPARPQALRFVGAYEQAYGPKSRNQFAAHVHDVTLMLEKARPVALAAARPGAPEFRAALRDALESIDATPVSQGMIDWTAEDHWGFASDSAAVMLTIEDGDWEIVA